MDTYEASFLEAGYLTPIYQGRSSNFREGYNLTEIIERSVAEGDMKDLELFVFIDNLVFDSVFYKGNSKILLLFEIFLSLHQV